MSPTRTIRLSQDAYNKMRRLKVRLERRNGDKFTYSAYLDALNKLAEIILDGQEMYKVGSNWYHDQSEAWGESVIMAAKGVKLIPEVYIFLGEDKDYQLPEVAP